MTKRASHIITIGELLANHLRSLGASAVDVVGNYQQLETFDGEMIDVRRALGIKESDFLLAYIGGFTKERVILPLIKAVEKLPDVRLLLAGDGPQKEIIEQELHICRQSYYVGRLRYVDVPDYTAAADVIYYGLRNNKGNSRYSSPNALFNALAAGKPIISTNTGEIARIVDKENCGIVVNEPTEQELSTAIIQLMDSGFRKQLGKHARNAAETRYNWSEAKIALLEVYDDLV
jgi:glycosyltransferase involved in cell wall biosynthesis